MDPTDPVSVLVTVWLLGVLGSLLAVSCLWLEFRHRTMGVRWVSGLAALLLLVATGSAWIAGLRIQVGGPLALLAAVCGLAHGLSWPSVQDAVRRLASPKTVWLMLLVAGPALCWGLIWKSNEPAEPPVPAALEVSRTEVFNLHLMTDRGRQIPAYNLVVPESATQYEETYIAEAHFTCRVIRTGNADPSHNCHGWVFTGGQFAVRSEDVEGILADNHYEKVEHPQPDDLIIYRDYRGQVTHTGLVRSVVGGGMVLIESKWGPLGRFLHSPDDQPYGSEYTYYRSPRHGHLLAVIDTRDHASGIELSRGRQNAGATMASPHRRAEPAT